MKRYRFSLIGSGGLISEALSNAYCHGHKRNSRLPVTVKIFQGKHGILSQVKDSGQGFDVEGMMLNYVTKKNYFHNVGNGTESMFNSQVFGVFYGDKGNAFHLLYLSDEGSLSSLLADYPLQVSTSERPG